MSSIGEGSRGDMPLNSKRFDKLTEADFLELIENRVPESKTLGRGSEACDTSA